MHLMGIAERPTSSADAARAALVVPAVLVAWEDRAVLAAWEVLVVSGDRAVQVA